MRDNVAGFLAGCISLFLLAGPLLAEEKSVQPYIDHLKSNPKFKPESPQSYTEEVKAHLGKTDSGDHPEKSYTEQLKESDPETFSPKEKDAKGSYTEKEKLVLEPKETGGAIRAVEEGRSELKTKVSTDIHSAFGLRYAVSSNRNFQATGETRAGSFQNVYGENYAPELSFFFELQPFHSEWFGSIGIVGLAGLGYYNGMGKYTTSIVGPDGAVPNTTRTKFQLFTLPAVLAVSYRFNLFRLFRPYIMAGPSLVGYVEQRSDGISGNRGVANGYFAGGGVAINLDWISSGNKWDLFQNYGIKHSYLTIDYTRYFGFGSEVSFASFGYLVGLAFEI